MKQFVLRFPFLFRVVLALICGVAAIAASAVVYKVFPVRPYFPFVAELLMILGTWILYRVDGKGLAALGLTLTRKTPGFLLLGFLIGVVALLAVTWLRTLYTGEVWHIATSVDPTTLFKGMYWILPTAIVQELMFRGYLFTKTIERLGIAKANLVFAFLFMLVHVADREVLKSIPQVLLIGTCTAIGHLWFATALRSSGTILFPIGLHWGNNWAATYVIGAYGKENALFFFTDQRVFTEWLPFLLVPVIFNGFYLVITWLTWKSGKLISKRTSVMRKQPAGAL